VILEVGELADVLSDVEPSEPRIPMMSPVTGSWIDGPMLDGGLRVPSKSSFSTTALLCSSSRDA